MLRNMGRCPHCDSSQPHLYPGPELCPDVWHRPVPVTVDEWRVHVQHWAEQLRQAPLFKDEAIDPVAVMCRISEDMIRACGN